MSSPTVHHAIQLLSLSGCSFCAVLLTSFLGWSLWSTAREGIRYLRRLHQIPCHRCRYFTGKHLLKCTVHPCKAFSEDAIDCLDFEARAYDDPEISCRCHTYRSKALSQQKP